MRRRTITLVIVGLVLALFVLPAAAEIALTDDTAEVEAELVTTYDPATHVAFFGIVTPSDEVPPPEVDCVVEADWLGDNTVEVDDDGNIVFRNLAGDVIAIEDWPAPDGCTPVLIEGPNGQVNHGQYVSNMVHAVKEVYMKEYGPFGQFLKDIKHDKEIGKGLLQVKPDKNGDLDLLEAAELDDEGDDGEKDKSDKSNKRSDKSKGKNG